MLKPAVRRHSLHVRSQGFFLKLDCLQAFLNMVYGFGQETGQYLLEDERIAMFTFTGSPGVGRHIKSSTGIRKITLELGNNSPNIIHKDIHDLVRAVELCVTRGYVKAGQACISRCQPSL
ncbi:aldehyde dehydrogenase family protein [Peribacillus frigoritolerans]|uniref:aldehyde dehydrogenase family protein n=1 Tax=Peribacillus frigoritolerans TaxID=450367 RepID=UPI003D2E1C53